MLRMSLPAIDVVQWRALLHASLRTDLRSTGRSFTFGQRPAGSAALIGSLAVRADRTRRLAARRAHA
jgi:hypothetical protein